MKRLFIINIIFFLIIFGCHTEHEDNLLSKIKKVSDSSKFEVTVKDNLNKDDYILWKGISNERFYVKKSWDSLKEQSCKNCHQGFGLKEMKGKKYKRAHWNIKLNHASEDIMNCQTCHNKNKVWLLNLGYKNININHSPKLCIKCHFKEERDWEIGAHGKRASGWQHTRAVYSCTHCHNPHEPSFKKRWPKVAPNRPLNNEERL